ncbi:hypothetical protein FKM82_012738, partial [Ascaphus truei]
GGTLQEVCKLSRQFDSIIPVKSNHERLAIDLSAPFLIQGNRWHYGCRSCSNLKNVDALHSLSQEDSWNATEIAKVLGIEPLRHVFLMQFTFDDETELLNAFLWNYSMNILGWNAVSNPTILQMEEKNKFAMNYLTL